MQRHIIRIGLGLLLMSISMSFKCGGAGETDSMRKYAMAADELANTIYQMVIIKRRLGLAGQIRPDEERAMTDKLLAANHAAKAFALRTHSLTGPPDPQTRQELSGLFADVVAQLNSINSSGIFNLKDVNARVELTSNLKAAYDQLAMVSRLGGCEIVPPNCVQCPPDNRLICR